jgi:hypothetical protein
MPHEDIHLNRQKQKNPNGLAGVKSEVKELTDSINVENFFENKPPLPEFGKGKSSPEKILKKESRSPLE